MFYRALVYAWSVRIFLFYVDTHKSSPITEEFLSNYMGIMAYSVGITTERTVLPHKDTFSLFVEVPPALTFLSSYLQLCLISHTQLLLTKELVSQQKKRKKMALYLWVHRTSSYTPLSRSSSPVKTVE